MEFWDEISKSIYSAADYTVKGTEKLTNIAKVKYKINALKTKLDLYYKSIGELKYAESKGEEVTEEMYSGLFAQVTHITSKINELEKQLADLREYTSCPQCKYRIANGLKFCPKCGERISNETKKEQENS